MIEVDASRRNIRSSGSSHVGTEVVGSIDGGCVGSVVVGDGVVVRVGDSVGGWVGGTQIS